jgi:hypothetical protein
MRCIQLVGFEDWLRCGTPRQWRRSRACAEHAPGRNLILDEHPCMCTLYKYQEWLQCIIFPVSHNWAIVVVENKSAQETHMCI